MNRGTSLSKEFKEITTMKRIMMAVVLMTTAAGAYAADFNNLQNFKASDLKAPVVAVGDAALIPARLGPAATSAYTPQECTLNITYKGKPAKEIDIDLVASAKGEEKFSKISGSLFITIVTKQLGFGMAYLMTVMESETGVRISANSNPLIIERAEYKAIISCNNKMLR